MIDSDKIFEFSTMHHYMEVNIFDLVCVVQTDRLVAVSNSGHCGVLWNAIILGWSEKKPHILSST